MKNFFNFNKNAGALAVLLCCFFFNLGVGRAQMGKWEIPVYGGEKIIITPESLISGVCADPAGYSAVASNFAVDYYGSQVKGFIDSAFLKTPPSKYFKVKGGDIFSFKVLIPTAGSDGLFQAAYRFGFNGEGYPPANSFLSSLGYGTDVSFTPTNPINPTIFVDGKAYQEYRAKGRIVGGNKKAWWMMQLKTYNLINTGGANVTWVQANDMIVTLPIISEGPIESSVPIIGTSVQPQIPYLVLHAPPGDGSSSDFQETKTTCREFVDTYAEDGSNSANLDVKLGVAGSLGFIATVDFEFSVTFSAGLTAGALAVTTKSNQTCVTTSSGFSTNSLLSSNSSGDVFVGYGTDLNYGIYSLIKVDPNTCQVKQDTGLIYTPTGDPRKFAYTEEAIQTDIKVQKAIAANPANSVRARNLAQNQADVWEKVLAQNNANKNNPNNALIENLSFSAGANSSQESSITVSETNSLDVEHYVDFNTGISTVVEIGGSGVSGGYEYKGSYRYGKTNNSSVEKAKVVRYNLSDNSSGDLFNLKVVRDPMYGTPVFRVEPTSITSCPYQGGYQRDQPKLKIDGSTSDHITLQGNPVGTSATFKLDICNESSEVRTYNLKLNAQTNLNGAVVSAAGVPLNGNDMGQVFLNVPANGCIQNLIIEVKQLSVGSPLSYPNLELYLYAPCEEDIQSSVFASVYFGNATAVNELADNSLLSVSPNPTSGWLQISLPTGNDLEAVRVTDLAGKTVRNLELGTGSNITEVDLSGLPKGMYALQARAAGQVFVKKVIVE